MRSRSARRGLGGWVLTVVIRLAFLSMSEALLRQGYLLIPEKAETADPAHSPCPPVLLSARVCNAMFYV